MPEADPATEAGRGAVRLCRADALAEIAEGRARGFDIHDAGRDDLFVLRHAGQLHGWRNACPHIDGAPMAWRRDAYLNVAGTHVVCAAHGALFDPASGECVQGPCLGQRLERVDLQIDAEQNVWVRNPRHP